MTSRAVGIDISKWNVSYNPQAASSPPQFVVQRVSYGVLKDECYDSMRAGVMQTPVRGAYHYLTSSQRWDAQADYFLSLTLGKGYHFLVCDFETAYNQMSATFVSACINFLRRVRERSALPVLLYTNPSTYASWVAPYDAARAAEFDLWVAQYPLLMRDRDTQQPTLPAGRKTWRMWQYTDKGSGVLHGVGSRDVDLNVYNGTLDDMRAWLGLDKEDAPPPPAPPAHLTLEERINYMENWLAQNTTYTPPPAYNKQ